MKTEDEKSNPLEFPVVGIGASAGGLEALQEFFRRLPTNPGASFVVIQHLSPDYKSLMDELLARCTSMEIHRVEDGIKVESNHIYLIPPRMNMKIHNGKLFLFEHTHDKTLNLPIDIFFRSLAKDQEKNAVGIILSGTGSDGTLGIRAIKELGGIAMAQDSKSAKFNGMPSSSISTGMVDVILPPDKLADEIANYVKHPLIKKKSSIEDLINQNTSQLSKVIAIINDSKNVDFSNYKENTILRRLEKRISLNRFENIEDYVRFLANNSREVSILFGDLLIGVTRFFRDPESFEMLLEKIYPNIIETDDKELRMWVSGCSTGEEAYSLAIMVKEYLIENNIKKDVKIFATDIDSHALEFAGLGLYPDSVATDIPPQYLSKYFKKKDNGYLVNENIRSMIIFARHDILNDPPFSKMNLISCRNLLIYLNNESQQKVLTLFYIALAEFGTLFLGSSESIGNLSDGFNTIDSKAKIYTKKMGFKPPQIQNFGSSSIHKTRAELRSISSYIKPVKPRINQLDGVFDNILSEYVPPSVIIDENYDIIHTIHSVRKFISIPIGEISFNLLKMVDKELAVILSSLLRKAEKKRVEVVLENISLNDFPEKEYAISCRRILDTKSSENLFFVSFLESDKKVKQKDIKSVETIDVNNQYVERIEELEKDLQFKSESLQATVEELETSNEELQSSNEELIASNEELQSTNEELQSVNEELYTVNSEHIRKIEELTELNADMDNLLKNTRIGTLFLDRSLTIRKINNIASELTNIRPIDIGRPIEHFSMEKLHNSFSQDLHSVLETLKPVEKEVTDSEGIRYLQRIIPYRSAENAVDGVIIIFISVETLKKSEKTISDLQKRLDYSLEIGGIQWWSWDVDKAQFLLSRKTITTSIENRGILDDTITRGEWNEKIFIDDRASYKEMINNYLNSEEEHYTHVYRVNVDNIDYKWVREKGGFVKESGKLNKNFLTGVVMDITAEKEREEENSRFKLLFDSLNQGVVYHKKDGSIIDANSAAQKILGLSLEQMKGKKSIDPNWKAVYEDHTIFPGEKHPAMVALKTGKPVKDVIMGIFNPETEGYSWIKVNATPLFKNSESTPYQVYANFEDITKDFVPKK